MKYKIIILAALLGSCGAVEDAIQKANTTTGTGTNTTTDQDVKTGSRTVATSTTTTVSESGDQSVFADTNTTAPTATKVASSEEPWADEACEDGIAYRKEVGPDGILTVITYVFDNPDCVGKPQVFVQRRKSEGGK